MIDGRRFTRGANLDERALRDVTVRRLKTDLPEKGFHRRVLKPITFTPSDDEQRQFAALDRILTDSARANGKAGAGGIVAMLLKKRFLSSPWAFARTLELYEQAGEGSRLVVDDEDQYYQEVLGSGQSDEEEGDVEHPEFTALRRSKTSDALVAATSTDIESLIVWGRRHEHRPDSRLTALIGFLDAICRPDGKTLTNERVVVFTEYAATLDWVARVLSQRGYRDVLATIQGTTPTDERDTIRAQFTEEPAKHPVRVLVATDSAGEGIDLQDHCHRLVNFDIPFNPSRLEQRIGRIDRYGQHHTPEIFQLVPDAAGTQYARDLNFLVEHVARKIGIVAADLGSVNQVIDVEVQNHFNPARTARKAKQAPPDDGNAIINRALAGGIELNRRLTELSQTYGERKAQMHLTPDNARRVVDTALVLTAQPPLVVTGDDRTDAAVFSVPGLGSAWQPALRGLDTRLEPGVLRAITFDDEAAQDRKDLVHVHLGHPLMQRSARVLRSALFSVDSPVNRVTAVVVDNLPQSCVAAVSRLVLVGRGGLRLHEEVFLTGIRLRGQAMAEAKVEQVLDEALDVQDLTLADAGVLARLAELWNADGSGLRTRLLAAMARRAESRQEKVTEALQGRRDSDIARAREIFGAFRINLRESRDRLGAEIRSQEEALFADDQQAQRRRDLRAMEDRLASLDDEEQREIAAIRERYHDIKPHVSAAAVVFALTPADVESGRLAA